MATQKSHVLSFRGDNAKQTPLENAIPSSNKKKQKPVLESPGSAQQQPVVKSLFPFKKEPAFVHEHFTQQQQQKVKSTENSVKPGTTFSNFIETTLGKPSFHEIKLFLDLYEKIAKETLI